MHDLELPDELQTRLSRSDSPIVARPFKASPNRQHASHSEPRVMDEANRLARKHAGPYLRRIAFPGDRIYAGPSMGYLRLVVPFHGDGK